MTDNTKPDMPVEIWLSDDGNFRFKRHFGNFDVDGNFNGAVRYTRADLSQQTAPAGGIDQLFNCAKSIEDVLQENDGFWKTCSGCYETEDGHDNGHYHFSDILKCKLGSGCSECGGIGAIWDTTDYEAMAKTLIEDTPEPPQNSTTVGDAAEAFKTMPSSGASSNQPVASMSSVYIWFRKHEDFLRTALQSPQQGLNVNVDDLRAMKGPTDAIGIYDHGRQIGWNDAIEAIIYSIEQAAADKGV